MERGGRLFVFSINGMVRSWSSHGKMIELRDTLEGTSRREQQLELVAVAVGGM